MRHQALGDATAQRSASSDGRSCGQGDASSTPERMAEARRQMVQRAEGERRAEKATVESSQADAEFEQKAARGAPVSMSIASQGKRACGGDEQSGSGAA